jgi:hypothetical protein
LNLFLLVTVLLVWVGHVLKKDVRARYWAGRDRQTV